MSSDQSFFPAKLSGIIQDYAADSAQIPSSGTPASTGGQLKPTTAAAAVASAAASTNQSAAAAKPTGLTIDLAAVSRPSDHADDQSPPPHTPTDQAIPDWKAIAAGGIDAVRQVVTPVKQKKLDAHYRWSKMTPDERRRFRSTGSAAAADAGFTRAMDAVGSDDDADD